MDEEDDIVSLISAKGPIYFIGDEVIEELVDGKIVVTRGKSPPAPAPQPKPAKQ